jgi:cytochrome c2
MISRFALAASLAFTVAACGSSPEPSEEPSGTSELPVEATAAPQAVATEGMPSDAPSATPTASPSPTETGKDKKDEDKKDDDDARPVGPPQAFNQCTACHSTAPGKTIIGPSLAGVYGHKAGQVPGFQFSDAMKNSGMVLNEKNLDAFLANPTAKVPGTTMVFAGVKDEDQREAIIDYLKTL